MDSRNRSRFSQSIRAFQDREELALMVPPSGTRSKVTHWKTGFYHIAHGAGVPIVLGFLDYRRKTGGRGPLLQPSGDIEADMHAIRAYYRDITGRHPQQSSRAAVMLPARPRG